MSQKERVNLVFLLTVTVYIGLSFVVSSLPIRMPFAVNILVSQLGLVLVPALFAFQSGYTPAELGIKKIPFRAAEIICEVVGVSTKHCDNAFRKVSTGCSV